MEEKCPFLGLSITKVLCTHTYTGRSVHEHSVQAHT